MKFSVRGVTSLEELSNRLNQTTIRCDKIKGAVLKVYFKNTPYEIVNDGTQFEVYKRSLSGIAVTIISAIPAAICYAIVKVGMNGSGFWLSMCAFIPFIIFSLLLQSFATVKESDEIKLLVEEIHINNN
jgi:ABC-type bacteriocin/lantibiotic exporter with double-glycine peptidase domain